MTLFKLADRLNKTISEIQDMTQSEFYHWIAYINIEAGKNGNDQT